MSVVCSMVVLDNHVYYNVERSGRNPKFEVYKIANAPDADPQIIYSAFKLLANELFRADVVSPRYDAPAEVPEIVVTEEIPADAPQDTSFV